jgi:ribosomal protein S18 acetylase RimI-like enzyme
LTSPIRPATGDDVAAIAAIAAATDLFPPEMTADMVAPALSGGPDLWKVAGQPAQGFAYAAPERMTDGTWNLLALAVHPDAQGRGIGTALIAAVEATLRAAGARLLLVETLGTPDFARTRALYAARGFVEEARIRDYYMTGGDKIVFAKGL